MDYFVKELNNINDKARRRCTIWIRAQEEVREIKLTAIKVETSCPRKG
jgi:hypothetical protein